MVDACRRRNHLPTVHVYPDHHFVTVHRPLLGDAGHVHLLELDMIVARRYLVTVHGPLNPVVDPREALTETAAVLRRITSGRLVPEAPSAVAYALGSAVARRQRGLVAEGAEKIPALEEADRDHARDLADQFARVQSIGEGERQFMFAVIVLYQTRVNTKMTVAMERLAVIAAVTLPVTAIASVLGTNVIVNERTHYPLLAAAVLGDDQLPAAAVGEEAGLVVITRPRCPAPRPSPTKLPAAPGARQPRGRPGRG